MKKETREKVVRLLTAIHDAGFDAAMAGNIAHETLLRIVQTGTTLPDGSKEAPEITEACAQSFSNLWVLGLMVEKTRKPEWTEFCEVWAS